MDQQQPSSHVHRARRVSKMMHVTTVLVLVGLLIIGLVQAPAEAAMLFTRSVVTSTNLPGAVSTEKFTFTFQNSSVVGSLVFQYCQNSPIFALLCDPPVGFDATTATLASQTGETGFTIHPNTSATRLVLGRAPSAVVPGPSSYTFSNIANPTVSGETYVRISSYSSNDGTGAPLDTGAVIFATNQPLTVSVYIPPFLILCAGVTVDVGCVSTTGSGVDLGELSKSAANTATTQFSIGTNSSNGYVASIQGTTMTAGNRTIPGLATLSSSTPGTGQFGINLAQNTDPAVGAVVTGNGTGVIDALYNNPNQFIFHSGDIVARSSLSTEFNRYTISYLVNVGTDQSPGRYAATITVIATTTF